MIKFTDTSIAEKPKAKPASERLEVAKSAVKASNAGRPPKHPDKPWEAEGISRMTWYRRKKAQGER